MTEKKNSKIDLFYYLALFAILLIYIGHAPFSVQTGDSGELSAAAYRLLVAHPPGYPLWVWVNHLWISVVSISTVFFSFSLLNILIALSTLLLIGRQITDPFVRIFAVLTLGLSPIFWRYSELPEVFIPHIFICISVIVLGISKKNIAHKNIPVAAVFMPIVFSLGVAHHHTIIFLLPLVAWVCWQQKKQIALYLSILLGIILCVGLYSSLVFMHPEHIYSWRTLASATDIWNHFLRKDFGTFTLQRTESLNYLSELMPFYFHRILVSTWPILLTSVVSIGICLKNKSTIVWRTYQTYLVICILAYSFIFVPLTKTLPVNFFAEVTERFFIMPIALIILTFGAFISDNFKISSPQRKLAVLSMTFISVSFFYFTSSRHNDFSDNTIIGDYASNILNVAAEFNKPLLLITNDTEFFSVRYTQLVENVQPQILVGSKNFFMTDWFLVKATKHLPDLKFDLERVMREQATYTVNDLIIPNEGNYTFITDEDEYPPEFVKITALPIGFILSKGAGITFLNTKFTPQFRSDISILTTSLYRFDSYRNIFSKYAYYFIIQGITAAKLGEKHKAIDFFERALGIFPINIQALENLCKLKTEEKIIDPKCERIDEVRSYFDYFRFNNRRYF